VSPPGAAASAGTASPSAIFEYRIVAKRQAFENLRMETLAADPQTIADTRALNAHRPTAVPKTRGEKEHHV
jgi:hypothetical protein